MTDTETQTTDPVHWLWALTGVLAAAAAVFYIVSAVAFNPTSYLDDPNVERGYSTLLVGAVLTIAAIIPASAGLAARAIRR